MTAQPADNPQHDVKLPPGATDAGEFTGDPVSRIIVGPDRKVGRASVFAMASQTVDGAVQAPTVQVERLGDPVSTDEARQLAVEILNAAEEADGWVGVSIDQPTYADLWHDPINETYETYEQEICLSDDVVKEALTRAAMVLRGYETTATFTGEELDVVRHLMPAHEVHQSGAVRWVRENYGLSPDGIAIMDAAAAADAWAQR